MSKQHGLKMYRKGCRCVDCKASNAAYQRDYYHRRKKQFEGPTLKSEAEVHADQDARIWHDSLPADVGYGDE